MQVHNHNLPDRHDQHQTLEHLTTFIQLFRRSISLLELIATLVSKNQDHTPICQKMKLVLQQLEILRQKWLARSALWAIGQMYLVGQHRTYHRFACRLLEIIFLYVCRDKEATLSPSLVLFQQTLKETEGAVRQSQKTCSFGDMIQKSQSSFLNFLVTCPKKGKSMEEREKKCQFTISQLKKFHLQAQNKRTVLKTCSLAEQIQSNDSEESQQDCVPTASLTSFSKAPILSKELSCIQKRFSQLRGMELDFDSFRCDYFMAKNSKQTVFREWMKRNELNKKVITTYYDDFHLFQKKKINKENRKNKRKTLHSTNFRQTITRYSMSSTNHLANHPNQSIQQQRTDKVSGKKKQLVMNNVQLSLGKGKIDHPKGTQQFLKKAMRSQYHPNQKQSSNNNNNSLGFLHQKLRVQPCPKNNFRTDTRQKGNVSSVTDKEDNSSSLRTKSRPSFKSKYLSINCGGKNESTLKRRIFSNGSPINHNGMVIGSKKEQRRKVIVTIH